ncbi:MAG: alpha/beta hydrolase family protein [Ktedonobacterales bacterium]
MEKQSESAASSVENVSPPTGPNTQAGGGRRLKRRHYVARSLLAALFLLGAALSVAPQGRAAARALLLLPALVTAKQPGALVANGDPVRHSTTTVDSRGGTVYLDIYEPDVPAPLLPGSREGVVIIPGVGDERKDSQLINLSESLAREGVVVMDLTTATLIAEQLTPDDGDAVTQAVLRLEQWPGVGAGRIGIFGISGGGALACLAAADPRLHDKLAFMLLFGGYFDASTLLRDFGRRALVADGQSQPWQPNPVPVQVLANTIASTLPADQAAILSNTFTPPFSPLPPSTLATLSPGAVAAYHLLAGDDAAHVDANLAALSPPMKALLTQLSPSTVVGQISTPIYLLHDRNDQYVPFTESREFDAALTRLGRPHDFVEFNIFAHVEVRSGLGLGPLLGDAGSLYRILTELLAPAS